MKMASSFTFNPLQRKHLFSIIPCKYPSSFSCFKSPYFMSDSYTIPSQNHTLSLDRNQTEAKMMASLEHKIATEVTDSAIPGELGSGFSSLRLKQQRVQQKTEHSSVMEEKMGRKYRRDGVKRKDLELRGKKDMGSGFSSSLMSVDEKMEIQVAKKTGEISSVVNERLTRSGKKNKGSNQEVGVVKMNQMSNGKGSSNPVGEKTKSSTKKNKLETPGVKFRIGLDMCSKHGDVLTAISLYESAQREGIKMEQYHYNVLLYLCSSAAAGIVSPAKTGNVSRTLNKMNIVSGVSSFSSIDASKIKVLVESTRSDELSSSDKIELNSNGIVSSSVKSKDMSSRFVNGLITSGNNKDESVEGKRVNDDVKTYALIMGFKIYDKMCLEKIPLSEATLTSVARMAMAIGDGDMAFEMVKKMKELGITQRLRSYGPALFTFCRKGETEKAFEVEEHMLQSGVSPEEPELEELLRVSVENGKHGKVYYILQKLRTSVRQVSPSTADLIERWFKSKAASSVGKRQWDQRLIMKAMENGGGGWHGQGWLGKGKWTVTKTCVKNNGVCDGCGIKLTTIDLDPVETENFAKSVASIAQKREKSSSFQNFQKWLDSYGPYEAVVDAANVGLFHQKEFSVPKVNAIVEGIRQKLPSKKIPLIVVHNKRIMEDKMGKPAKMLIEKWNKANALYSTPTGSNDDWYWLYAAIKFKCLLVTNDEMRDHLFQLLGNDFFPRWKERHQVRFTFNDDGPEVHMPPSCSVVIQESEKGHWHVPIASEHDLERERTWLCITRNAERDSSTRPKGARSREKESEAQSKAKRKTKSPQSDHGTG